MTSALFYLLQSLFTETTQNPAIVVVLLITD